MNAELSHIYVNSNETCVKEGTYDNATRTVISILGCLEAFDIPMICGLPTWTQHQRPSTSITMALSDCSIQVQFSSNQS